MQKASGGDLHGNVILSVFAGASIPVRYRRLPLYADLLLRGGSLHGPLRRAPDIHGVAVRNGDRADIFRHAVHDLGA